jgi:hypothetical protein
VTELQGTPPRPTTPADVEMNSSEAGSREVDVDRFQPQWDGEDSVSLDTSTHLIGRLIRLVSSRTSGLRVALGSVEPGSTGAKPPVPPDSS